MATLGTIFDQAVTALATLSGTPVQYPLSDYATREPLTAGTTYFQVQATQVTVRPTSEINHLTIGIDIFLHHRLAAGATAERDYVSDVMSVHQEAIMVPSWWTTNLAALRTVIGQPTLQDPPERTGKVISYSVRVEALANPT